MNRRNRVNRREWEMPSKLGAEIGVVEEVCGWIKQQEDRESRIDDIATALAEACINAAEHGNRYRDDRYVTVQVEIRESEYIFRIYDQGNGIRSLPLHKPEIELMNEENPRGWGLYFIRTLADQIVAGIEQKRSYLQFHFTKMNHGVTTDEQSASN